MTDTFTAPRRSPAGAAMVTLLAPDGTVDRAGFILVPALIAEAVDSGDLDTLGAIGFTLTELADCLMADCERKAAVITGLVTARNLAEARLNRLRAFIAGATTTERLDS